jgi:hypothetical protein
MGDCRERMELYLRGGAYSLVGIEERSNGFCWARLEHVGGPRVNGHDTVWFELVDDDDRDFALDRYLMDQFAPPTPRSFGPSLNTLF